MRLHLFLAGILTFVLVACAGVRTEPAPETRVALAPTGKLRVGLYLGNPLSVIRDPASGELRGAGFDLGTEMARRMRVPFDAVVYPSVGALLDAAKSSEWDVAFFQVSAERMNSFDFTGPLFEIELGYLVPAGSPLAAASDVDKAGIRIAVPNKGQGDVILTRLLKQAQLVRVAGLAAAVDLMRSGNADAVATIKPSLHEMSRSLPGSRILEGSFATERIAMAVPKGRGPGVSYARTFIEDAKRDGMVAAAVEKAGVRGATVAPAR